jgi:hypothetical protein
LLSLPFGVGAVFGLVVRKKRGCRLKTLLTWFWGWAYKPRSFWPGRHGLGVSVWVLLFDIVGFMEGMRRRRRWRECVDVVLLNASLVSSHLSRSAYA